ncbi:DNA protecting protein DprA [Pseudodesulfovibrio profundus]|uniref:DNA protecting protein DprA n=1 Tax=Pseudodesulfovibrio profundus TaxID=57320 RepID=A0A2C8F614_9BACT|nr:DNA-processing protein DprA [Pseudodesulfovibrio profundus]SOB57868.1 DNA protecting protein DprA [Pseudodesulfovibrio profundus]
MNSDKEFFSCLALKHTPGLGPVAFKQLLSIYPSAYDAVKQASTWKAKGVKSNFLAKAVQGCIGEVWREKAELEFKASKRTSMEVLTWNDQYYPDALKNLHDPPLTLYYQGDLTLLSNPGIAVVGARECTSLGLRAARNISAQLAGVGITVVSGLALGIDRQAHLGGLQGIGSSIAVLGCGLDIDYPYDNLDVRKALNAKGLVVTEFGPGEKPRAKNFPVRNRLISALSLGVLVAEAAHQSGSLITARLAAEQGKDVFALPGPLGQPTFTGCHRLIKQGAALVESAEDIVEILRYDFARELADIPDPESDAEDVQGITDSLDNDLETSSCSFQTASSEKQKAIVESVLPGDKRHAETHTKRPTAVERQSIQLNTEELEVMRMLEASDRVHIDEMSRALEWTSAKISKVLLMLEIRGAVRQLPGMWYLAKEG